MYPTLSSLFREAPPVDVYDTEEGRFVEMEMAGLKSEHVQIEVEGSTLLVRTAPPATKERVYLHRERLTPDYSDRRIKLPASVDTEKIEATMADGLLTIRLPLRSKPSPIPIRVNG